jgi:hypothetical protein
MTEQPTLLPGASGRLREQVTREQARLRVEAVGPQGDGVRHLFGRQSAGSLRLAGFEREKLSICSQVNTELTTEGRV